MCEDHAKFFENRDLKKVAVLFTMNRKQREGYSRFIGRLTPNDPLNLQFKELGTINKVVLLPSSGEMDDLVKKLLYKTVECHVIEADNYFRIKEIVLDEEEPDSFEQKVLLRVKALDERLSNFIDYTLKLEEQEVDETAIFIDWQNVKKYFEELWTKEISDFQSPEIMKKLLFEILKIPSVFKSKRRIAKVYFFGYKSEFPLEMLREKWSFFDVEFIITEESDINETDLNIHSTIQQVLNERTGISSCCVISGDGHMIPSVELIKYRNKISIVIGPTENCNKSLPKAAHLYFDMAELIGLDKIRLPGLILNKIFEEKNIKEQKEGMKQE